MLNIVLDKDDGLAILQPEGALSETDFDNVASVVDPYLVEHQTLNGLIIYTRYFPGWESFGAMSKHFRIVKDHHRKLSKVALVTDSNIGNVAEKIAGHFVSAEIQHFPYNQFENARKWITGE